MKKKTLLALCGILVVMCVFALTACSSGGRSVNNTAADVNVIVLDAYGQPVQDASVTLAENKAKAVKTDASGIATFKKLETGEYGIKVEKDGYAAALYGVESRCSIYDNVVVPEATYTTVTLRKLGAAIKGRATVTVNGVPQSVPSGTGIKLTLDDWGLFNRLYTATTDSSGYYAFNNLPEGVDYAVWGAAFTISEVIYNNGTALTGTTPYTDAAVIPLNNLTYSVASGQFVLSSMTTLKLAARNSDVVINFSQSVNVNALTTADITMRNAGGSINIPFTRAWSDNNKTLTLKPAMGNWGGNGWSFTVRLSSNFYSASGIRLSASNTDITVNLPDASPETTPAATGLAVKEGSNRSTTLIIEWNNVETPVTTYTVLYRIVKGDYNVYTQNSNAQSVSGDKSKREITFSPIISGMEIGETLQIAVYASVNGIQSAPATISVAKVEL